MTNINKTIYQLEILREQLLEEFRKPKENRHEIASRENISKVTDTIIHLQNYRDLIGIQEKYELDASDNEKDQ